MSADQLRAALGVLPDHPIAVDRQDRAREDQRPYARRMYIREAAEAFDPPEEDGRYLSEVLLSLTHEVDGLMFSDRQHVRSLALIKTKLEEAYLWSVEYGRQRGAHIIIDRRRFKVPAPEEVHQ